MRETGYLFTSFNSFVDMKRLTQLLLMFAFVAISSTSVKAQDIHFSQFYLSPLNLNPAMTGVMNCNVRLVANYRNQWSSVLRANAFKTYSASYDQRIAVGRYDFFGIGGSFWGDKAGESEFSTLQGKLSASYSKKMGGYRSKAHYLVFGAEVGVTQRSVDFQKLRWGNQADNGQFNPDLNPDEVFNNNNLIFADISAGVLWFTVLDKNSNLYIGGAYHHLNRADQSFNNQSFEALYSKFTLHAGGEFLMTSKLGLVPGVVTLFQGPSFELNTGTSLKFLLGNSRTNYQAFQLGAWMRISNHFAQSVTADAFILSTKFDYNDFSFGFSYDVNVSSLKAASNSQGAFEFAMTYKICGPENRSVYCPNF